MRDLEEHGDKASQHTLLAVADYCVANINISLRVCCSIMRVLETVHPAVPCLLSTRFSLRFIMNLDIKGSDNQLECLRQILLHVVNIKTLAQAPALSQYWARLNVDPEVVLWPGEEAQDAHGQRIYSDKLLQDAYTSLLPCIIHKALSVTPKEKHTRLKLSTIVRELDKSLLLEDRPTELQARVQELEQVWQRWQHDQAGFARWLETEWPVQEQLALLHQWARSAFDALPRPYLQLSFNGALTSRDIHVRFFEFVSP